MAALCGLLVEIGLVWVGPCWIDFKRLQGCLGEGRIEWMREMVFA
jgi:hypothetical protein